MSEDRPFFDPDGRHEKSFIRAIAKTFRISEADARQWWEQTCDNYRQRVRMVRRVLTLEGYADPGRSIWENLIEYLADLLQVPPEQAGEMVIGETIDELRPILAELTNDLVRLDQLAAIAGRSKHTLRKWVQTGKLPGPVIEGGNGQPHLYSWSECRPRLQLIIGRRLPLRFPGNVC